VSPSSSLRRRLALALATLIGSTLSAITLTASPALAATCDTPSSTLRVTHVIQCDGSYGYKYYASNVHHDGTYWRCNWIAYTITIATGFEYRDSTHDKTNVICGMATRNSIVSKAQAELANKANRQDGHDSGCNFYTGAVRFTTSSCGHNGTWGRDAWCADFAKWVWQQSGASVSSINGLAGSFYSRGTSTSPVTWHVRSTSYTPRPGDAVIFDWESPYSPTSWTNEGNNINPVNHVGIVISYSTASSGTLVTIEGNSGDPSGGSVTGLWKHTRTGAAGNGQILGYISPM
jgi:hypothetical protein